MQKPLTKILLVVNVGSLEERSNQPKYKEPRTSKKSSYTFYATGETRSITSHITRNTKNVIYIACSAGVKAACSYCYNRHLCYDEGRLGSVKIVTLRVGARAKDVKRGRGGEKKLCCGNKSFGIGKAGNVAIVTQ